MMGGVALLVAIVVLGVLAVRLVGGALGGGPFLPGGDPSSDVCPPADPASPVPAAGGRSGARRPACPIPPSAPPGAHR